MPTAREATVNKPLSGEELKKVIIADFARLVENEGLLSPHIAYSRIGYTITLQLHVDNPYAGDSRIELTSQKDNRFPVMEPPPLVDPSPEASVGGVELHRDITSPNAERLRADMAIPTLVKGQDGTIQTESIKYSPDAFPELGPGEIKVTDVTEKTKSRWRLR
jgi:hypothetical protein